MKLIALLFFFSSFVLASEHRLLLTGFTKHEISHSSSGYEYNEFNYGAGYEYTSFEDYKELYWGTNLTILRDSYDEWQYTLSLSPNIRFSLGKDTSVSIGAAIFLMYKKDNYKNDVPPKTTEYDFIGGLAPVASLYYKDVSVSAAYVPSFSDDDIETTGFLIVYFGWKFK
ncbi:MAG: hypothetical protein COA44_10575 [Arcobacter sp.]|nr:MAG: hypothetical protein COA44_10575 [Arcobacter sp.]